MCGQFWSRFSEELYHLEDRALSKPYSRFCRQCPCYGFGCKLFWEDYIEVRDSQRGYFIPVRYGLGVYPDGRVLSASSSSSPPPPLQSASVGNSDPKYVNVEFRSETPSSGPFHSIRRVKVSIEEFDAG